MIKKPITIQLSTGLEARPVAQLVQVASQFNSEIYVEIGRKKVNAKSIMGMMTLGLDSGEEITLSGVIRSLTGRRPVRPMLFASGKKQDYKLTMKQKQGIIIKC